MFRCQALFYDVFPLPLAIPGPTGLSIRCSLMDPMFDTVSQPNLVIGDLENEETILGLTGVHTIESSALSSRRPLPISCAGVAVEV